jgi:hypothetical protein
MSIKTVLTCPLGSKCEEVKDGAIHRCAWHVHMAGTDPSTGEQHNDTGCAMSWMPILLVENSRQQVRTTATLESFRNETVAATETTQKILMVATALARPQQGAALPPGPAQAVIGD